MRKLAIKTRKDKVETEHYGYLLVLNSNGELDKSFADDAAFYVRSCIKAIQAKVSKEILGNELSGEFLAMALASHRSSEKQIQSLEKMSKKFSIKEEELHCGLNSEENRPRFQSKLRHYCAGKHLAMLAAAKKAGFDKKYYKVEHPLQIKVTQELELLSGEKNIDIAEDGCGLPTYFLSLSSLAKVFIEASKDKNYQEIFETANKYADLISDTGRLDQELMKTYPGKFFCKSGADGLELVLNLESKECLIVKVLDGNKRIKDLVAKSVVEELSWIEQGSLNLEDKVYTSQAEAVGEIQTCLH